MLPRHFSSLLGNQLIPLVTINAFSLAMTTLTVSRMECLSTLINGHYLPMKVFHECFFLQASGHASNTVFGTNPPRPLPWIL